MADRIRQTRANDLVHWQTKVVVRSAEEGAMATRRGRYAQVSTGAGALPNKELGFAKGALIRDPDGHAVMIVEK